MEIFAFSRSPPEYHMRLSTDQMLSLNSLTRKKTGQRVILVLRGYHKSAYKFNFGLPKTNLEESLFPHPPNKIIIFNLVGNNCERPFIFEHDITWDITKLI